MSLIWAAAASMTIRMPLSRFRLQLHPRESFRYEYDFIDNWRVDIRLEEILVWSKYSNALRDHDLL
jgi:hypothetical protein